jgi:glycerophosphoryl diester phosphodiesterase
MTKSFWDEPPIAIAHRGGAAAFGADKYRVENTVEAFANAIKLGYKYLELDVMKTADNKVALLHVASYKAEGSLRLKDTPSPAKLQKMDLRELKNYLGRDIPTLDELLIKFPKAKFFVDAKTDEVVKPLAELIRRHDAYDRVIVGSFFSRRLIKTREMLGPKALLNLNRSKIPLKLLQGNRFLKSSRHKYIGSVHLPYIWTSNNRIKGLQQLGVKVLVWSPNTEKKINEALNSGADGIISDNIILLKKILESRKANVRKSTN